MLRIQPKKWDIRKGNGILELNTKTQKANYLRGIPNEWCLILKQQYKLCYCCSNEIRRAPHLKEIHGIEITNYYEIWKAIKEFYLKRNGEKKPKGESKENQKANFPETLETKAKKNS